MGSVRGRTFMDFIRYNVPALRGITGTQLQRAPLWNDIYSKSTGIYEWGCKPSHLFQYIYRHNGISNAATLKETMPSDDAVLLIGAGASQLGDAMYEYGYEPVVQTDFSEVVVNRRREALDRSKYPKMYWELADARLPLHPLLHLIQKPNNSDVSHIQDGSASSVLFGSVLDKGLIDGLYLAGGESMEDIPKVVSNVANVLTPESGVFVTFSYSHPNIIEPLLKHRLFGSIEARLLETPDIYLYRVCRNAEV